jgi:hypothetical protein
MTQVESLQTENNRLVELQQVLINQIAFYDDGDLIEMYLERIGFRHEHHDAYRIFGKPHYLQYIKDRFEREDTDMRYLNLFQVICRKWLVRRDLSPDIFEADQQVKFLELNQKSEMNLKYILEAPPNMTSTTMTFMEYENRIIKLQQVVRLRRKYKQWRIKNIKAPPTYIPTGPFNIIKKFCGFDPLYRHKKISGFIREAEYNHHYTGTRLISRNPYTGDDGYHFQDAHFPPERRPWEWHRNNSKLLELKAIINPRSYERGIMGSLARDLQHGESCINHIQDRIDYKSSLIKLLDYRQATTVKQLKQYCRDNKIVGYSKLKKAELKQLIIKTPH